MAICRDATGGAGATGDSTLPPTPPATLGTTLCSYGCNRSAPATRRPRAIHHRRRHPPAAPNERRTEMDATTTRTGNDATMPSSLQGRVGADAPLGTPRPDLPAIKTRQKGAWSSGDYALIGTTLQIVGEELCEAMDMRAGQRVLDVAAGNGNASLAAARRWCKVTATDYVPELLSRAGERAAAERLDIAFREADAEALPFPDGSFDAVVSTFGV